MIKAVTKDGTTKVVVNGDVATLCGDTCGIMHGIWSAITEKDKAVGKEYEKFMRKHLVALVFDEEPECVNHEQGGDEFAKAFADVLVAAIMGSES